MRQRILKDSGRLPDSTSTRILHDTIELIDTYRDDSPLRSALLNPKTGDTLVAIYFGDDTRYAIIKRFCSKLGDHYEEILAFKTMPVGEHKFFYCSGQLKKSGLEYNGPVGVWKEFDTSGKVIKTIDYGKTDSLENLRKLSYRHY